MIFYLSKSYEKFNFINKTIKIFKFKLINNHYFQIALKNLIHYLKNAIF